MRFAWPQHLHVARVVAAADHSQQGTALALMGVSLLMLAQDLLDLPSTSQDAEQRG